MIHSNHSISLFLFCCLVNYFVDVPLYCVTLNSPKKKKSRNGREKSMQAISVRGHITKVVLCTKTRQRWHHKENRERVINTVNYSHKNRRMKQEEDWKTVPRIIVCTPIVNTPCTTRMCCAVRGKLCVVHYRTTNTISFLFGTSEVNIYLFICARHTINQ